MLKVICYLNQDKDNILFRHSKQSQYKSITQGRIAIEHMITLKMLDWNPRAQKNVDDSY